MTYFGFRQNNSYGRFDIDPDRGISVEVWVEAEDEESACRRAEQIGLYFDGCQSGMDCTCCGDRWYRSCIDQRKTAPKYVRSMMEEGWAGRQASRHGDEPAPEGYVHPLKGEFYGIPYKYIPFNSGEWKRRAEDVDGSTEE